MRHVNHIMRDMFDRYPPTPEQKRQARLAARDKYMPVIRRILDMDTEEEAISAMEKLRQEAGV